MNKFLTITNVLLLAISGYLGYEVYKLKHPQSGIDKTKLAPANVCPSLKYDYSNSDFEGIINYPTARILADNYNNNKKGVIVYKDGSFVPGEDSRSVWFSLERLKNFIWHIEKQNCQNSCTDSLGLRIYFGRYPNLVQQQDGQDKGLDRVPKEYSNRHTLFMVPTYRDATTGLYYDFLPGGKNCRAPLETASGRSGEFDFWDTTPYIFMFDVSGGDSQNHGGLIPPGNPAGTSFN